MIIALGDTQRNGAIDFNAFIRAIDLYADVRNFHPSYSIKKNKYFNYLFKFK